MNKTAKKSRYQSLPVSIIKKENHIKVIPITNRIRKRKS